MALRDSDESLLSRVRSCGGPVPEVPEPGVDESGLVQLLYTSGTTSAPRGAMMSHRALVHEYFSTIVALDLTGNDAPLHVMPLYHSAGMHVWMMPYLAVGAANQLMPSADVTAILEQIEETRAGSIFWRRPCGCRCHSTRTLRGATCRVCARRSMVRRSCPCPSWSGSRRRCPGGLLQRLRAERDRSAGDSAAPEEHAARPASCGRAVLNVEIRVIDGNGEPVEAGGRGEVVTGHRSCATGTGTNRK